MYNLENYLLNLSMVATTFWIIKKYLNIFLEKKKLNFGTRFLWILFAVYQFRLEFYKGTASIWTTIVNVILVLLISISCYKKGKNRFFIVILLYAIWALIEMFVFFCMQMLPIEKPEGDMVGSTISKIVMIMSINLLSASWKKKENRYIPGKYYVALLLMPMGSIYIAAHTFFSVNQNSVKINSLLTFSILLLFNIVIFEIYSKLMEFFIFENEMTVYAQQIDIIAKNTDEQKKMMEDFHKEKHNLINELIVIRDSIEHCDKECVIRDMDKIICAFDGNKRISDCGNSTIDALINYKYITASKDGIVFSTNIFIPDNLPINQCDIGVVLGNALDNAIEATKICIAHEKIIEITMGIKKGALVLVLKNPFEHDLKKDNKDSLLSTKRNGERHGYGIGSIEKVVERYYGEVLVETINHTFVMTVIMNLAGF